MNKFLSLFIFIILASCSASGNGRGTIPVGGDEGNTMYATAPFFEPIASSDSQLDPSIESTKLSYGATDPYILVVSKEWHTSLGSSGRFSVPYITLGIYGNNRPTPYSIKNAPRYKGSAKGIDHIIFRSMESDLELEIKQTVGDDKLWLQNSGDSTVHFFIIKGDSVADDTSAANIVANFDQVPTLASGQKYVIKGFSKMTTATDTYRMFIISAFSPSAVPIQFENIISTDSQVNSTIRKATNYTGSGATLQNNTSLIYASANTLNALNSRFRPFAGEGNTPDLTYQLSYVVRLKESPKGDQYIIYRSYAHDMTFKIKEIKGDTMWLTGVDSSDNVLPVSMLYTKGTASFDSVTNTLTDFYSAHGTAPAGRIPTKLDIVLKLDANDGVHTFYLVDHEHKSKSAEDLFFEDPYSGLQALGSSFTANYPIMPADLANGQTVAKIEAVHKNFATPDTYLTLYFYNSGSGHGFSKCTISGPRQFSVWAPFFDLLKDIVTPYVARYTGNDKNPDGTSVTSGDLWNKLFTVNTGDRAIHFGFFNHPGKGIKIYSYDPNTNKLTDFEGFFSPHTTSAKGNYWYRLTYMTTTSPTTRVFEIHLR